MFGSSRYLSFLQELAPILRLADCAPDAVYLGGLDRSGIDGEFAYCYQDDITQGGRGISTVFTHSLYNVYFCLRFYNVTLFPVVRCIVIAILLKLSCLQKFSVYRSW